VGGIVFVQDKIDNLQSTEESCD
jgi:hypothetical protein